MKNWEEFYEKIERLSLPELEIKINKLYIKFQKSHDYKNERLDACLSQRKYLINQNFKFTPEVVNHIERVNRILTENRAKVLTRCGQLYRQMLQLKSQGDEFLDDFDIEGTVAINFHGEESVLTLDQDENNGQSDYIAMADVLDFTQTVFESVTSFSFSSYSDATDFMASDKKLNLIDFGLEYNWNDELLSAPELSSIPYFCYASHVLFVDLNYSLSDIIRFNDFCNEVKVSYQNNVEK